MLPNGDVLVTEPLGVAGDFCPPVQAGKSVFGEKDPAAIMKRYKEGTYLYKEGGEPVEGKIPIGVFKHDTNAEEYIERVERRLRDQGIERG